MREETCSPGARKPPAAIHHGARRGRRPRVPESLPLRAAPKRLPFLRAFGPNHTRGGIFFTLALPNISRARVMSDE